MCFPTTAVEQQLTEIWQHLLHVEQVGVRDNFFALGGDSLAIAGMMLAIAERFNTAIPMDGFFRSPTIENNRRPRGRRGKRPDDIACPCDGGIRRKDLGRLAMQG